MSQAYEITAFLGGRWYGCYGTAPCPICQPDRRRDQNALTLTDGADGRLLTHCKKAGCAFVDILGAIGSVRPYIDQTATHTGLNDRFQAELRKKEKNAWAAAKIWQASVPIAGTPAENYLRGRGITCELPETLRFNADCWHHASRRTFPALVALVEGSETTAIHRTWISEDGASKAAVYPAKAMLGSVTGGAVRLVDGADGVAVAEGIETALSLACGILSKPIKIWSALSAHGLQQLCLPTKASRLIVATDGDPAGRGAGQVLAERATALGWDVSMLYADDGEDWNDVLQRKSGGAK